MLGEVFAVGGGLDAEVADHGVGLPPADELDGGFIDVGAKQRSSSAWTEAPSADVGWVDACR